MADYGWKPLLEPDAAPCNVNAPADYCWRDGSGGLENAVKAGFDKDGGELYVGRAFHEGDMVPAKVAPNAGCAFISHDGEEHSKLHYEVLCNGPSCRTAWQNASSGQVPYGAIVVGTTGEGEKLYAGRVLHDGTLTPGKVHPSHGCCYIPYGGEELSFQEYEILVVV